MMISYDIKLFNNDYHKIMNLKIIYDYINN